MQINNIGILSPGDMGSAVGKVLIDNGYKVFTNLDGRSKRTKNLSEKAGIISLPSLSRILSDCEIVLSILVPSEALGLAKRISKTNSSNNLPLFVDCNAVSPTTKKNISKIMIDSGMEFIDGGIVGPPPRDGNIPRLYVSGPKSSDLLQLNNKGIEVVVLGKEIGQASSLKMWYASITKGKIALYTSALISAYRLGIYDSLIEELNFSQKDVLSEMSSVNSLSTKAFRWIGEMNEIAETYQSKNITSKMHFGAAETFSLVADSILGDERPETYDTKRILRETISMLSHENKGKT